MKTRLPTVIFRLVILLLALPYFANCSISNHCYSQASPLSSETPGVILQQGTAGASVVYTNNTSATVSVASPVWTEVTYDYVLEVVNQVAGNWTVYLEVYDNSNIARLSSLNISLHDGTSSNQIAIRNGSLIQTEGQPYSLPGGQGATIYISMYNLQSASEGTAYLYVNLKIQMPNASTYNLLIVTFEIT